MKIPHIFDPIHASHSSFLEELQIAATSKPGLSLRTYEEFLSDSPHLSHYSEDLVSELSAQWSSNRILCNVLRHICLTCSDMHPLRHGASGQFTRLEVLHTRLFVDQNHSSSTLSSYLRTCEKILTYFNIPQNLFNPLLVMNTHLLYPDFQDAVGANL